MTAAVPQPRGRRDEHWLVQCAPGLLTLAEVSAVTGRDRTTIEHLIDTEVLSTVQGEKRIYVPRVAVLRLLGLPVPGEPSYTRRD